MSFSVVEQYQGANLTSQLDDNGITGNASVTRVFNVVPDTPTFDVLDVSAATGIPRNGDIHPSNFALVCRSKNVRQVHPGYFEVECTYTAKTSEPEDEAAGNPLEEPAVIEVSAITSEEPIDEDVNGDPIATVNGEPIVGLTMAVTDMAVKVTRNLPTFNIWSIAAYTNKVNSTTFLGSPAGTVRIMDIQASSELSDEFEYWKVSVTFHIRRGLRTTDAKAWYKRVKHEGYYVKVGSDVKRATDSDGNPVVSPVPLKSDGTEETDKSLASFLEFQVYESVDFNAMNLL